MGSQERTIEEMAKVAHTVKKSGDVIEEIIYCEEGFQKTMKREVKKDGNSNKKNSTRS